MAERLDTPRERGGSWLAKWRAPRTAREGDRFGRISEQIARFMGTPLFIVWMTLFCAIWLVWNSWGPEGMRFDKAANGFTALTLMLSLQASYSAPLILLSQNRQTDRDRVQAEQDRQRAERNLADTEYLAREMAAVRIALSEVATRDYLRSELRSLLEDLEEQRSGEWESSKEAEREAQREADEEALAAYAERESGRDTEPETEPAPDEG